MTISSELNASGRPCSPSSSGIARVLVTGAGGFIGSHIVEALVEYGLTVRALVRKTSSREFIGPKVEQAFGDVTDSASLHAALSGVQAVIHCAGLTKARSLADYRRVNRDGTERLLAACAAGQLPLRRILCLSSLAAFGPSREGRPALEDDAPHPVSDYGRSKLEGQRVAESFMKDLPVTILIPPAVYGPRDRDIYTYFKLAKLGFLPLLGRRERYLSLVYVKDLARAAVACLVRPEAAGRSYFIEDGEVHTWRSCAGAISAAMGARPARLVVPRPIARAVSALADCSSLITRKPPLLGRQKMRELLETSWTCSADRIRRDLGFVFEYPLPKGIEETYRWYIQHNWL